MPVRGQHSPQTPTPGVPVLQVRGLKDSHGGGQVRGGGTSRSLAPVETSGATGGVHQGRAH